MPAPTSYSETDLALYMHEYVLGGDDGTAGALGWADDDSRYTYAVANTLRAYGVSLIADATDMAKLEALARVEAWRAVVQATAAEHDYASGTADFKRSQINAQARAALADAEGAAFAYTSLYSVGVSAVRNTDTPYTYWPDELRTLPGSA